jgi:hypothetical protein
MRRRLSNPVPWLIGAFVIVGGGAFLWLSGSAVVVDETDGVLSAVITNGHSSEQRLHRLWHGYFYAIPNLEGTIEVRCRNGIRKQWGYVTGKMHTKIKVVGNSPCSRVIEAPA